MNKLNSGVPPGIPPSQPESKPPVSSPQAQSSGSLVDRIITTMRALSPIPARRPSPVSGQVTLETLPLPQPVKDLTKAVTQQRIHQLEKKIATLEETVKAGNLNPAKLEKRLQEINHALVFRQGALAAQGKPVEGDEMHEQLTNLKERLNDIQNRQMASHAVQLKVVDDQWSGTGIEGLRAINARADTPEKLEACIAKYDEKLNEFEEKAKHNIGKKVEDNSALNPAILKSAKANAQLKLAKLREERLERNGTRNQKFLTQVKTTSKNPQKLSGLFKEVKARIAERKELLRHRLETKMQNIGDEQLSFLGDEQKKYIKNEWSKLKSSWTPSNIEAFIKKLDNIDASLAINVDLMFQNIVADPVLAQLEGVERELYLNPNLPEEAKKYNPLASAPAPQTPPLPQEAAPAPQPANDGIPPPPPEAPPPLPEGPARPLERPAEETRTKLNSLGNDAKVQLNQWDAELDELGLPPPEVHEKTQEELTKELDALLSELSKEAPKPRLAPETKVEQTLDEPVTWARQPGLRPPELSIPPLSPVPKRPGIATPRSGPSTPRSLAPPPSYAPPPRPGNSPLLGNRSVSSPLLGNRSISPMNASEPNTPNQKVLTQFDSAFSEIAELHKQNATADSNDIVKEILQSDVSALPEADSTSYLGKIIGLLKSMDKEFDDAAGNPQLQKEIGKKMSDIQQGLLNMVTTNTLENQREMEKNEKLLQNLEKEWEDAKKQLNGTVFFRMNRQEDINNLSTFFINEMAANRIEARDPRFARLRELQENVKE